MRNSKHTPQREDDIVDVLAEEHAALRMLAEPVGAPVDDGSAYLAWSDRVIRHEIAEELVVYPVLLGRGKRIRAERAVRRERSSCRRARPCMPRRSQQA